MSGEKALLGGCMCGEVRFEAKCAPAWVVICNCRSCRRATGGVLVEAAGFPKTAVAFTGAVRSTYASSAGVLRSFCARCGTSLAYENERWPDDIHMFAGSFDELEALEPQFHIFHDDRISWLRLTDNLPRYKTTPSAGDLVSDTRW
jgi:hypothetical protein